MADSSPASADSAALVSECARLTAARVAVEDNLRRNEDRLRHLYGTVRDIAHDLNNNLAPILLSVDLLRLTTTDSAEQKLLDTIEKSARHGADVVRTILGVTREIEATGVRLTDANAARRPNSEHTPEIE